ncbi:MAG: tRNA (guanosine(37)-N1)-methyltransferase TrmD [Lentisphaerae bacterium]|jgi:tRNA (guanine37-N1)-methyltransferase|nr:tRNA (guanosine(37)-N1)-methyltransferase TrmD [Lentisphaerota bacterium]MBT4819617.1 tRNA (guanosine(37)-N1)-methyltransferase TrmD [Lentisphaerota bacterium]MBT5607281.1 tRNA (guanosine(37)-N1)-methyltransferase TrmD [Lentisphaerota bacterium]MBT7058790.1 tRNA (guanosine(37)-N1)-methyltransferase TrmD [Lentisphaerota bacterium]MBT7842400.1 tRNA (guanosine(37)-N1)-methyltransferase TrmD [Lentisphaerota bacterium]
MRLDIITLFPELASFPLSQSIIGRAQQKGIVRVCAVNPRDYTNDKHRTTDERPYGGGAGMVMKPDPLFAAVEDVRTDSSTVILLSPQGHPFTQKRAQELAEEKHIVLVCGHYEGVDERVRQSLVDDEISIGDYVLTNGALAALVIADAVIRLLPGALGCAESSEKESFADREWLEFPQYTRPPDFRGMRIPDVLLSGNHKRIEEWRQRQRLLRTAARRPDLLHKDTETTHE